MTVQPCALVSVHSSCAAQSRLSFYKVAFCVFDFLFSVFGSKLCAALNNFMANYPINAEIYQSVDRGWEFKNLVICFVFTGDLLWLLQPSSLSTGTKHLVGFWKSS